MQTQVYLLVSVVVSVSLHGSLIGCLKLAFFTLEAVVMLEYGVGSGYWPLMIKLRMII